MQCSALATLLAITAGCAASHAEPAAETTTALSPSASAIANETIPDETTSAVDISPVKTSSANTLAAKTSPAVTSTPPAASKFEAGEPGYIDYPYMGQTERGEDVYYIYSEPVDCTDAVDPLRCEQLVKVQFVQVDMASTMAQGSTVVDCVDNVLTEVLLDNDLIAYRMAPGNEAMVSLVDFACYTEGDQYFEPETKQLSFPNLEPSLPLDSSLPLEPSLPQGIEEGMLYATVRALLIEQGWIPKAVALDHYTSLERRFYDNGYQEVLGCSGSGLCRFEFDYQNEAAMEPGMALAVITYLENDQLHLAEMSIDFSVAPTD
ncbi:MAG: hypothetical protein ACFBSF_02355 [Leptolyngbyaceae cyanobacterium]